MQANDSDWQAMQYTYLNRGNYQVNNYAKKMKKIVANTLRIDEKRLTIKTDLRQLGVDSLDIAELLMEIEEHFEISIPDEDAAEFLSLRTAIDYIIAKKTSILKEFTVAENTRSFLHNNFPHS